MTAFNAYPRVEICHGPTPIESLPRLSKRLNTELLIKRDDCTGLAGGGNKTRKLEYLIADAQRLNADTLITIGGFQSNHARQTAAAAAKLGFDCELILQGVDGVPSKNYADNGNVLLDQLLGANIHRIGQEGDCDQYCDELVMSLQQQGKTPYVIPVGGSNTIGSLGYVRCGIELAAQLSESDLLVDHIVLATGSAGTQAGLLAGLILANSDIKVLGICVSRETQAQETLVEDLLSDLLISLDLDPMLAQGRVVCDGGYYGPAYGVSTPAMVEAVELMASMEGILLDPVYTGKAMAGLIDKCQRNEFKNKKVLFLHTGGSQGLFAYQQVFDK